MKIKFQVDADFSHTITKALRRREPAIEFQSADDAKLRFKLKGAGDQLEPGLYK